MRRQERMIENNNKEIEVLSQELANMVMDENIKKRAVNKKISEIWLIREVNQTLKESISLDKQLEVLEN